MTPTYHLDAPIQSNRWPSFPASYRELFSFSMPELRPDENNLETAIWTGKDPPEHPLAYTYRDPTIVHRALHGLWLYLEGKGYLDRAIPVSITHVWTRFKTNYDNVYDRENWLQPVLHPLRSILQGLMEDLNLGSGIALSFPWRQFSQEGNVGDWLILQQSIPLDQRRDTMVAELNFPGFPPKIGGGSAMELKLTAVLENYQAEYFSAPYRAFIPSKTLYTKGDAIMFKLDLRMCNRTFHGVSARAPRFGLVYSGHKCIVVENLHPLVPSPPFEPEIHNYVPSAGAPHPSCRGAGQSDIHALVPSRSADDCPLIPFFALLVAINAPPGTLAFADPDPALGLAGYEYYLAALSTPPPPSSSQEADPVNSDRLMIAFSPPLSPRPQPLQKVTRTQIEEGMAREWKHAVSDPDCSPPVPLLSLRTVLPSGREATVHRGTLGERAVPVVAKLYEFGSGFEALLRELDAYECMEGLECVPRCLGVYAPAHRAWAALLLEDKGDSLGNDWWKDLDLDVEERWAIYEAVEAIHAAGVSHNDVEVRNIVRNEDGELYVIDFGHASVGHRCEPETSWCSELRCLWDDLDLGDS